MILVGTWNTIVESTADSGCLVHQVSKGNWSLIAARLEAIHVIFWQRVWFFFFCPCLENIHEAKLKSNILISLAEAILRQHNVDSV